MKQILSLLAVSLTLTVISCGSNDTTTEKQPFTTDDVKTSSAPSGEDLYKRNCASCHMAAGDGIANVYPPLAKSDYLNNREQAIHQVINGSSGKIVVNGKEYNNTMPPQRLNDDEVAAVLTFVYTNKMMENNGQPVTAEEVKAVREKQ